MPEGLRIRQAEARDAARLAPLLRAGDRAELQASCGADAALVLAQSLALSTHAWCAEDRDGTPLALWGVGPLVPGSDRVGCVWLLAGDRFDLLPRHWLARRSRRLLAELLDLYPRLENRVDARHRRAVRWLAWLGFAIERAEPWGIEGRPFHRFSIAKEKGPAMPAPVVLGSLERCRSAGRNET